MKINPVEYLKGSIRLPGDKSISHRAAMLAATASGETRVENFASSADCASTVNCLRRLGVEISREDSVLKIKGVGKKGLRKSETPLDCGNSGTTVRLLSGILAGQPFETVLIGDESLSRRPMKRIIEPLTKMGAHFEANEGHLPMRITGINPLQPITYETPIASAQVKSAVLLAGLNAAGKTTVVEKIPTRDHTERMLRWFGAEVTVSGEKISVSGDANLEARDLLVPSDISSAAFFLVAAACLKNSELLLPNVGLNSTRNAVVKVLQDFGADIEIQDERENCNEPVADILVRGANLGAKNGAGVLRGEIIANLIDEIPILAVFGTQAEGGLEVRDAAELRVKESDRISAVVENLRRMGARVEEFPDGLRVEKSKLKGARIESFGDHRIAMAFAIAALFAEGESFIEGADSAAVSFPEFFEVLRSVTK